MFLDVGLYFYMIFNDRSTCRMIRPMIICGATKIGKEMLRLLEFPPSSSAGTLLVCIKRVTMFIFRSFSKKSDFLKMQYSHRELENTCNGIYHTLIATGTKKLTIRRSLNLNVRTKAYNCNDKLLRCYPSS
jgi:hypothetical protein